MSFKSFGAYRQRLEGPQQYFAPLFPDARRLGNEMITAVLSQHQELENKRFCNGGNTFTTEKHGSLGH